MWLEREVNGTIELLPIRCGNKVELRQKRSLIDCFPDETPLNAGRSAVLAIDALLEEPLSPESNLTLTITFPDNFGFQPLRESVAEKVGSGGIAVDVDDPLWTYYNELDETLSCLLNPGSEVANEPSIQRLKLALGEMNKAEIRKERGGAVLRYDRRSRGIWIYPDGLSWTQISEGIEKKMIVERAIPFAHLMDEPQDRLFGTALFPFAIASPGMPDGFGARSPIPLRPLRLGDNLLAAGVDPASGLDLPATARILMPGAEPVAFSMLPAHLFSRGALATHESSAAPFAWRVDLPDLVNAKRGGRIWYFSIDPKFQGLLLGNKCHPENKDLLEFLCTADLPRVQSFEPVYEEKRFFTLWLWMLRAARESAVTWQNDAPIPLSYYSPPVFVSPAMIAQARIDSATSGLVVISAGVLLHAVFVIWLRWRGRRRGGLTTDFSSSPPSRRQCKLEPSPITASPSRGQATQK